MLLTFNFDIMEGECTSSKRQRMFTLNEVLSQLEDDVETVANVEVFISPPGDGNNSDEDDVNDDIQESICASDLSGRQLRSRAQALVTRTDGTLSTIGDESDDRNSSSSESEDSSASDESGPSRKGKRKVSKPSRLWRKEDNANEATPWTQSLPAFLEEDLSPTKCFERFFDDEIVAHMIKETKRYAGTKGDHTFDTNMAEMRAFLAILFISGYNVLPRRKLYWQQEEDVLNNAISGPMSRNRFDTIMKYLHLADNDQLQPNDKFAKVRPLYNLLNERFMKGFFFPLEENLSIDESMVPYYGKHSCKQCIRGKPIRFGYKQWVLATPLGYADHLELYQGARRYDRQMGLGHGVSGSFAKGYTFSLVF